MVLEVVKHKTLVENFVNPPPPVVYVGYLPLEKKTLTL